MARTKKADKLRETWPRILALLADGLSLRAICRRDDMPHRDTVREWIATDESGELTAQYVRARQWQAESYAAECLELADASDAESPAGVNKARLQVDTRKWIASKLYPRVYGDRVDLAVSGTVSHELTIGGVLAQSVGPSIVAGVTPATLGTARVVEAETLEPGATHNASVHAGEDEGASGGRRAQLPDGALDPLAPDDD